MFLNITSVQYGTMICNVTAFTHMEPLYNRVDLLLEFRRKAMSVIAADN